ncbi:GntR family transcriptional regulator [Ktedonosporobacter rubrisoli]|nr:GntR family transcriptional regulator [Ktedonosporobacter rubrisoli]
MMINHRGPEPLSGEGEPLYTRLRDRLATDLAAGRWEPGSRLPSERALSEQYGCSRLTVRQALSELEEAGLLIRRRGSGTFVAQQLLIRKNFRGLSSFSDDMRQRGLVPGSVVLQQMLAFPNSEQRRLLGIAPHEGAVIVKRLRLANEIPMALETAILPAALCPGLEQHGDLDKTSLYEILEREYGLVPDHAQEVVEAMLAGPEEAQLLKVDVGAALLRIRRLTFDKNRRPFEHVESLYCGDKYSLGLTVRKLHKSQGLQPEIQI